MNRRDLGVAGVLLFIASTLWSPQSATAHTGMYQTRWVDDLNVEWQFASGVPQGARAAIRQGAAGWNGIGRALQFTEVGNLALQAFNSPCAQATHQNNGVFWVLPAQLGGPNVLGLAVSCVFSADPNRLFRTQIAFNNTIQWHLGAPPVLVNTYDLAAVSLHEFGHASGSLTGAAGGHFADSDGEMCPADRARHTMCQSLPHSTSAQRTPEPHDIHNFVGAYAGETFCGIAVFGEIRTKFVQKGSSSGILGCPTGNEQDAARSIGETDPRVGGRSQRFERGGIYFHPVIGAREVHGEIGNMYRAAGGVESQFGFPTTDERVTPDGTGWYNHFNNLSDAPTCENATHSIYFTAATGAREVHGDIRAKWCALGWELSALGYPATNESRTGDGTGWFNHFKKPGHGVTCVANTSGSIFSSPGTGTHEVHGDIRAKWCSLGWENGLGYPTTDETRTPDGTGVYNHFRNTSLPGNCGQNANASIYFSPASGTHEVRGEIRAKWCGVGWESGILGYPTSGQVNVAGAASNPSGQMSMFQSGRIYDSPATDAHEVHGDILNRYLADGGPTTYGFPLTDEFIPATDPSARQSDFELASIRWIAGTTIVCVPRCV